mgnify:CR=1 FL=1
MPQTIGEKRVRIEFNPSNSGNVNALKQKAAEAINILQDFKDDPRETKDPETMRLVALAQTAFEEAAMWAVKAITS